MPLEYIITQVNFVLKYQTVVQQESVYCLEESSQLTWVVSILCSFPLDQRTAYTTAIGYVAPSWPADCL